MRIPYFDVVLRVVFALLVVGALLAVAHYLSRLLAARILQVRIGDNAYTTKVSKLLRDVLFIAMSLLALLLGFQIVGLNFALLIGGITLGITLGCADFLTNMIAWILVMTNSQYKIGDFVYFVSKDQRVYWWRLDGVNIKHSILKSMDRRRLLIPNILMITRPVIVYSETWLVRIEANFDLPYMAGDVAQILDRVKLAVNEIDWVDEKDSTRVVLTDFGDKWLNCRVYAYFYRKKQSILTARSSLQQVVYGLLRDEGIRMPYPHVTTHMMFDDQHLIQSVDYVSGKIREQQLAT